jgi:hypothetical protein
MLPAAMFIIARNWGKNLNVHHWGLSYNEIQPGNGGTGGGAKKKKVFLQF